MTDEEKKAMDDLTGKEISFEINWTPEQRKTFENIIGLTEFRENCIKVDTLINLVQKQEKVIDEMAKEINDEVEKYWNLNTKEVIELFYRKVEENG